MSILDIVIFALLGLAFILGLIKGFGNKGINSVANAAGILLAYFAGIPVARALMNTTLGYSTLTGFYESKLPTTGVFTETLSTDLFTRNSQLSSGLSALHIPSFFQGIFVNRVTVPTDNVSKALSSSFAFLTLIAIFFILFYLVGFLLIKLILGKIRDTVFGEGGKSFIGRLSEGLVDIVRMSLFIFVVFFLLLLVDNLMVKNGNNTLDNFFIDQLKLSDSSSFGVGRIFYNAADSFLKWISLKGK